MRRHKIRLLALGLLAGAALAQQPPAAKPVENSALDAPLFYQLLIGEIELRSGQAGNAYEVMLDAARRTKDEALFLRAVEIALAARAGDQALAAANAWRTARPESLDALRYVVQLLVSLGRPAEAAEPLRALIAAPPAEDRSVRLAQLPRLFARTPDKRQALAIVEPLVRPYLDAPDTRTAARVALGRMHLIAGDPARALELARQAQSQDVSAEAPALLALEMLPGTPAAEELVKTYLAQPKAQNPLRMVYVRVLSGSQRYADALVQLEDAVRVEPNLAAAWLSLGALHLELRHPQQAEAALRRYLDVVAANPAQDDDDGNPATPSLGVTQAQLMLAQAAEQRSDFRGAEEWLSRVDNPRRALDVQVRRATILAKQGRIGPARELIRATPERSPDDARSKLLAEAQMLREVRRWREAYEVFTTASQRFADDVDLLYEQAMVAEKLDRLDEMERLLRRVIALKPDHHHAYNALGYSLADRNLRLAEARDLIRKALELAPGEPFITDSLGWVEYRLGNREEALRLLRQAYLARPDVEIGAHLGEVLWVSGQRDEARRIWRESRARDATNEVLRETLARLRVDL